MSIVIQNSTDEVALIDYIKKFFAKYITVHEQYISIVKNAWKWCEEAYEDALKELHASMKEMKRALKEQEKKWLLSECEREQALAKITDLCRENSELKTQLYDEQGRNKKLLAQLNHDYENSSIPSSQSRNRSKIPNNRECTKRTRGAAMSTHHGRKKQIPTKVVCLPAPKEVAKDPGFKKTNKTIIKQLISVELIMNVTEYQADGYNLYRRMQKYKTQHLLFLHDMRVPTTNNTAERCLRDYKRKQTFAMTFRSFESIEELCQSKGVLLGVRKNNPNLYTAVKEIFNR